MTDAAQGANAPSAVEAEHDQLSALLTQVGLSFADANARTHTEQLTQQLDEGMEAHFAREESLYYPTIWALRPQFEEPLRRLMSRHDEFRSNLASIREAVQSDSIAEAGKRLAAFAARFREHEAAEQRILDALREEGDAPAS